MKARNIECYVGAPPSDLKDGTELLLKVDGEWLQAEVDFGGYTTRTGHYIPFGDIDEWARL